MMDMIREQLKKPVVVGGIAFVVGILLGWMVLGWWLFPVEWTDADLADLRFDAKVEYLRATIDSYAFNLDNETARQRYASLGTDGPAALDEIMRNPDRLPPAVLQDFRLLILIPGEPTPMPGAAAPTPMPGTAEAGSEKEGSSFPWFWLVMCVVVLGGGGGLAYYFFIYRPGVPSDAEPTPAMVAQESARSAPRTNYSALGAEPPIAQFMTSYKLGDDLYDESFSIDSPAGEFLGECGVEISELIGVGDPKKVTAFEVWLFDMNKNETRNVTKVFYSAYAFNDPAIRQRLDAQGEPFAALPGNEAVLETEALRMVARVVDMAYGQGPLPAESFFDRFLLELSIWVKK